MNLLVLESLAISEIDISLAICTLLVNKAAYKANICAHNYLPDNLTVNRIVIWERNKTGHGHWRSRLGGLGQEAK